MEHLISLKKVWEDTGFFEVDVVCQTSNIQVNSKVYIPDEKIEELCAALNSFINDNGRQSIYWENFQANSHGLCRLSFQFSWADKLGHIRVEVYLEIADRGCDDMQSCKFFVYSETQSLINFKTQLNRLENPGRTEISASLRID